MENIFDKTLSIKKCKLTEQQAIIENNILIECEEDVEKILAANVGVDLDQTTECLAGECLITGKLVTSLVFAGESGEIGSQTSVSAFSYKLMDSNVDASSKLNVCANVVSNDVSRLSGNQLKVLTTLNIDGVVLKNVDVEYLKEGGENSHIKLEEKDIDQHSGKYCEKFEESLQATVKTGVKKVLMTNVDCVVKQWEVGLNFVSVEMELCAKVLYADSQEISELQNINICKNVKQEFEASGVNKDSNIDLFAVAIKELTAVELVENNGDVDICVNVPIMVCFNAYTHTKILAAADIYSEKDVLSVFSDSFDNYCNLNPEYLENKIEGMVTLSEEQPRIDKYLATTNVAVRTCNGYVQNGTLTLEGIISGNVIYLNDETAKLYSVEIEIPFVLDKKVDAKDGALVECAISLFDVDVMVKRGRDVYFDAKAKAFVNLSECKSFEVISKVEQIAKEPEKDGSIEIYFAKAGETFWDIAKNLKISSEIIRSQNPDLLDPLDKDQNIALYYQKQRN